MLSAAQIKHLTSLQLKKYRQKYAEFVIEGGKILAEALQEGVEVKAVIATPEQLDKCRLLAGNIPVLEADEKQMKNISSMSEPPGILAWCSMRKASEMQQPDGWQLALDGIRDPGNLGTIIRTADWFGVRNILLSEDCADIYNPKTLQSSMGSMFRCSIIQGTLTDLLRTANKPVFAAAADGDSMDQLRTASGVLVIGSESHGISEEVKRVCDHSVAIPGDGRTESLNAAVAAGILLYGMVN